MAWVISDLMARALPLPPEPWGSKFRRAREDVGGYNRLEDVAREVSRYKLCSTATISRMENLPGLPTTRSARATAYIACVIYGVDPSELDLDPDDVPAELVALLKKRPRPKNACLTADELRDWQAA
jgi:hypothetical protein